MLGDYCVKEEVYFVEETYSSCIWNISVIMKHPVYERIKEYFKNGFLLISKSIWFVSSRSTIIYYYFD